jgi:integrase
MGEHPHLSERGAWDMAKKRKPAERAEYGRGSIYPTPNGGFIVAVRLKKGEAPTRRRASSSEEAERIRAELLALRDSGVRVDFALAPFEKYANWWYKEVYLQTEPSERSQQFTIDIIQWYVLPTIGSDALAMIEYEQLQRLVNGLKRAKGKNKGKPLSAQTKNHVARILREMFRKALQAHFIERDPSEGLVAPKIDRTPKEAPTADQVRTLLALVEGHPHALAYHIMGTLGTRIGETLSLRRIHFNADFTEVKIDTAISYRTLAIGAPKRDSKRPLPVPPHLAERARRQWALVVAQSKDAPGWNPLGYIMPSEAGTPFQPSNFEKAWNGYKQTRDTKKGKKEYTHLGFKQRAKWPDDLTLHSLRSFVATTLEDVDAPQRTIGHILGHGAKNMTEHYIRRSMSSMRRALERLEMALWGEGERQERTG